MRLETAAKDVYLGQDLGTLAALEKSWKPEEEDEGEGGTGQTHAEETRGRERILCFFCSWHVGVKRVYVHSRWEYGSELGGC